MVIPMQKQEKLYFYFRSDAFARARVVVLTAMVISGLVFLVGQHIASRNMSGVELLLWVVITGWTVLVLIPLAARLVYADGLDYTIELILDLARTTVYCIAVIAISFGVVVLGFWLSMEHH